MRVLYLALCTLIIQVGCGDVNSKTNAESLDTKPVTINNVSQNKGLHLLQLARNQPFIYDFAIQGSMVVGVGTDELNRSNQLFTLDETYSWEKRDVLEGSPRHFKGITTQGENLWIVGTNGIVAIRGQSSDDWKKVAQLPVSEANFIAFANNRLGFIVCKVFSKTDSGLKIFRTQDAGVTWKNVYENLEAGNPFDLAVLDDETILVAVNDEYLLRSNDGGYTWNQIEMNPTHNKNDRIDWIREDHDGASDIEVSKGRVWIAGEKGSIYFSEDKGKTWTRPSSLPESVKNKSLTSVSFSLNGNGVAVGDSGYMIFSTDFGETWNEPPSEINSILLPNAQSEGRKEDLHRVRFFDDYAIILGSKGVYKASF
jgi:photosystem II stability/assembly factor-like uncharacterized protein